MSFGGSQGTIRYQLLLDDQASQKLKTVQQNMTQLTGPTTMLGKNVATLNQQFTAGVKPIQAQGNALTNLQTNLDANTKSTKLSLTTLKNHVLGMGQAVAGAVGLATSFNDLTGAQIRNDKAQVAAAASANKVGDIQKKLAATAKKFGENSKEAAAVQADLKIAMDRAKVAGDRAAFTQDKLGDTYANFAANIIPSAIFAVTGFTDVLQGMGVKMSSVIGIFSKLKGAFSFGGGGGISSLTSLLGPLGIAAGAAALAIGLYENAVTKAAAANKEFDLAKKAKTLADELEHIKKAGDELKIKGPNTVLDFLLHALGGGAPGVANLAVDQLTKIKEKTAELGAESANLAAARERLNKALANPALKSHQTDVANAAKSELAAAQANVKRLEAIEKTIPAEQKLSSTLNQEKIANDAAASSGIAHAAMLQRLKEQFLGTAEGTNVFVKSVVDAQKAANLKEFDVLLSHGFVPPPLDQKVWHSTLAGATDDIGKLAAQTKNFGTTDTEVSDVVKEQTDIMLKDQDVVSQRTKDWIKQTDALNSYNVVAQAQKQTLTDEHDALMKSAIAMGATGEQLKGLTDLRNKSTADLTQENKQLQTLNLNLAALPPTYKQVSDATYQGTLAAEQFINTGKLGVVQQNAYRKVLLDYVTSHHLAADATSLTTDKLGLLTLASEGNADAIKTLADEAKKAAEEFQKLADAADKRLATAFKIKLPDADKELKKLIKDLPKSAQKEIKLDLKFKGNRAALSENFQTLLTEGAQVSEKTAESIANDMRKKLDNQFGKNKEKAFPGLDAALKAAIADPNTPAALKKLLLTYNWTGIVIPTELGIPPPPSWINDPQRNFLGLSASQLGSSGGVKGTIPIPTALQAPDTTGFDTAVQNSFKTVNTATLAVPAINISNAVKSISRLIGDFQGYAKEVTSSNPAARINITGAVKSITRLIGDFNGYVSRVEKANPKVKIDITGAVKSITRLIGDLNGIPNITRTVTIKTVRVGQAEGGIWPMAGGGISNLSKATEVGPFVGGEAGRETLAFIPHKNPGRIMGELEEMFGRGSTGGEIVVNVSIPINGNEIVPTRTLYKKVRANLGNNRWTQGA